MPFQALRVRDAHPAELAPPEVVTGLREPVPAAQVLHREACLGLPQEPDDLRFRKSLLHARSPFPDDRTLNRSATQNGGDVAVAAFLRSLTL